MARKKANKDELEEVEEVEEVEDLFNRKEEPLRYISTGVTLMDCALGGGYPLGRVTNLVGDSSTGKTLLAGEASINFFKEYEDGNCYYKEAEAAYDFEYARRLKVPVDKIDFVEGINTVEALFDKMHEITKDVKVPQLSIIDSLDALQATEAQKEDKKAVGGYIQAQRAKLIGEYLRKVLRPLAESGTHFLIVSQIRQKLDVIFGKTQTRNGGKALQFYSSQVIWLNFIKAISRTYRGQKHKVGNEVQVEITKNKVGMAYAKFNIDVIPEHGVDDITSNIKWLKKYKYLKTPRVLAFADDLRERKDVEGIQQIKDMTIEKWEEVKQAIGCSYSKY